MFSPLVSPALVQFLFSRHPFLVHIDQGKSKHYLISDHLFLVITWNFDASLKHGVSGFTVLVVEAVQIVVLEESRPPAARVSLKDRQATLKQINSCAF